MTDGGRALGPHVDTVESLVVMLAFAVLLAQAGRQSHLPQAPQLLQLGASLVQDG